MSERWIASKFGLFDFWYYDEEEFQLSNGKIIFRGTNGSGKSVTTQSFIPLLLDGDKRPSRLDPFGSNARRIENYLLLNENENDKIAYLYMEFVKPKTNTYLTIGIGFRARRGKKLECWHFILKDGRRINKDFKLYKKREGKKFALTEKEFKNVLGEGNIFTISPQEYMEKVNEHLFGYSDIDNYKDLLKLLIQIRSPKLSKDFKPTVIYEILKSSLSLLSEDDLRTMSEAMDNMDSLNNKLDELNKSKYAAEKIKEAFNKYNINEFYNKSRNYYEKLNEVKNLEIELKSLNDENEIKKYNVKKEEETLDTFKKKLDSAKIKEQALKKSDEFNARDDLYKSQQELEILNTEYNKKNDNCNDKRNSMMQKEDELKKIDYEISRIIKELKELIEDEEYFRNESYIEEDFGIKKLLENKEFIFDYIKSNIDTYDRLVNEAYSLILQFDNIKKELNDIEQERDNKESQVNLQENKLKEAEEYLTNIKSEYIEKINEYLSNTDELKIEENNLVNIFKEINEITGINHCNNILVQIREHGEETRKNLFNEKFKLENKKNVLENDFNKIKEEIINIENSHEVIEEDKEILLCRKLLNDNKIPYESFYKCVNFNEEITEDEKVSIEGSLFNMGILTSFIVPAEYKVKVKELLKESLYKIIFTDVNEEEHNVRNCFYLENNDFTNNYKKEIETVLKGISSGHNSINNTFINKEFLFGIGIISGGANKDYNLKYIGSESRENFRRLKINQLQLQLNNIEEKIDMVNISINKIDEKINKLQKEVNNIPSVKDIEEAINIINETNLELNSLEISLNVLEEKLDKARNKYNDLNIQVFNATEYIKIPKNKESYDKAKDSIKDYRNTIENLDKKYLMLNHKKSQIDILKENINDIKEDIDFIYGEVLGLKDKIANKENYIKALEETILKLNLGELDKEYEEVTNIINSYPNKILEINRNIARDSERINIVKKDILKLENKLNKEKQILEVYFNIVNNELSLKYIKELEQLSVQEAVKYIMKNYDSFNISKKENTLQKLFEVCNKYSGALADYNLTSGDIFNDYKEYENEEINTLLSKAVRIDFKIKFNRKDVSIYSLVEYLNETIELQKLLITEKEKEVFEDTLINTLSTKINAKIHIAKSWVSKINELMENMNTSNGLKLSLKWLPKKANSESELDIRELTKILGTPHFMTDEQRNMVSNHFKEKLKKQKRIVKEEGGIKSYQGIISDILDYRQWFDFELWYSKPLEPKKELTDNAFFRLSGGEKAMAMYIPLFTAVNARYNGAGNKDCPRIIALDEAFAGVDEKNISYMFELIESLKLDYVLNSQVLWGTYESVKNLAIYELIRQGEDVILPIKYHWNGKVKTMEMSI